MDAPYKTTGNRKLAKLIYDRRTIAGLTQEDLARQIGRSPHFVSKLEQGHIRGLKADVANKLCQSLGIEASTLLTAIGYDLGAQQ